MASIIIDEILPTKWRLRLRDGDGKTREVDYRAGTPLELGANTPDDKSSPREKPEATSKKHAAGKDKTRAEKSPKDSSSKAHSKDHAHKKPEAPASKKSEAAATKPADAPAPETATKTEAEPPRLRRRKPDAGTGPGELVWEAVDDDGVPGIRAPFERGAFKILHAGGDAYGLFYEWNSGKYQTLSCGPLESLKQTAAAWTGDGQLKAPRTNLGAEVARVACAVKDEGPATPTANTPPPSASAVDPAKDRVLMEGFEATVQKLLAAKKGSP